MTWQADGVQYMFSGRMQVVKRPSADDSAEVQVGYVGSSLLLNDFWQFDASDERRQNSDWHMDAPAEAPPRRPVVQRLAVCGQGQNARLDEPDVFGWSSPSPGQGMNGIMVKYPGPRYAGAAWVGKQRGGVAAPTAWIFGGIGLAVSALSVEPGTKGTASRLSCTLQDSVGAGVGGLCDLWSFVAGNGWVLLHVCDRDRL